MSVQTVSRLGFPHCLLIENGDVELIVTTDVGPRILRYGLPGQQNMLGEFPKLATPSPLGEWKPYGGHRLWAGPESMDTSYAPDNVPVHYEAVGDFEVRLQAPVDASGLRKEMTVRLAAQGTSVEIEHAITNCNGWSIQIAAWPITVVIGGTAILPREPFRSHDDCVVPAQPLTLWHFTDLQDPRILLGGRYIMMRADNARPSPQKIGLLNRQGWCAHHCGETLMLKRFQMEAGAQYPDFGVNNEVYVAGDYMEVELLGPLQLLGPQETVRLSESWQLVPNVQLDANSKMEEEAIHRAIAPHIPVRASR
ncbi:MAG: hypothetical protein ACYDC6_15450 [Acidobacteriaceae bacterium]